MKRARVFFFTALSIFALYIQTAAASQPEPLTIGADSSLEVAFKELLPLFEHEYGQPVQVVYGPSKWLRSAIVKGRAIDVLITSTKELTLLQQANLLSNQPQFIAETSLVLVSSEILPTFYSSFREMLDDRHVKIAVADSRFSSLGELTSQLLMMPRSAKRASLVYTRDGKDISKFLRLGKADVGIMYRADAINRGAHILEEFTPAFNDRIGAGITTTAKKSLQSVAKAFVDFMSSTRVQLILAKYGYEPFSPIKHAAHRQSSSSQLHSADF